MQQFTINQFENPQQFDTAFTRLQEMVIKPSKNIIYTMLDQNNPLIMIIASNTLAKAVDIFDSSIKTLKAAPAYNQSDESKQDLVEKFYTMIKEYWKLFATIASATPTKSLNAKNTSFNFNIYLNGPHRCTPGYYEKLKEKFKYIPISLNELNPSPGFNCFYSQISNPSYNTIILQPRSEKGPDTLEDYFTLAHQNILICISIFLKTAYPLFENISLPSAVRTLHNTLLKLDISIHSPAAQEELKRESLLQEGKYYTCNLIGINYTTHNIIFSYNIPLKNHNACADIIYDIHTKKTRVKFFAIANYDTGNFRYNLFKKILHDYMVMLQSYLNIHILDTHIEELSGFILFELQDYQETTINKINQALTRMLTWMYRYELFIISEAEKDALIQTLTHILETFSTNQSPSFIHESLFNKLLLTFNFFDNNLISYFLSNHKTYFSDIYYLLLTTINTILTWCTNIPDEEAFSYFHKIIPLLYNAHSRFIKNLPHDPKYTISIVEEIKTTAQKLEQRLDKQLSHYYTYQNIIHDMTDKGSMQIKIKKIDKSLLNGIPEKIINLQLNAIIQYFIENQNNHKAQFKELYIDERKLLNQFQTMMLDNFLNNSLKITIFANESFINFMNIFFIHNFLDKEKENFLNKLSRHIITTNNKEGIHVIRWLEESNLLDYCSNYEELKAIVNKK